MTDSTAGQGAQNQGQQTTPEFTAITSQEQLERVLGGRLERERAKFGDYDDLKSKATRLDEIEAANQTEVERARAEVDEAKAEVAKLPGQVAEKLREHLIEVHEIPADDAELFLTATDPDLLLKQVQRLVAQKPTTPVGVVRSQGTGQQDAGRTSSYETSRERGLARFQKT